jgi:ornithine decarboxylase
MYIPTYPTTPNLASASVSSRFISSRSVSSRSVSSRFWACLRQQPDRSIFRYYPSRLLTKLSQWNHDLPNVKPFYAIKCNPHPEIIKTLLGFGNDTHLGFDCASRSEIQTILNANTNPNKIIFANPIKLPSDLNWTRQKGIDLMTADCVEELDKIKHFHPTAKIILRIAVDDSKSVCKFSKKFGLDANQDLLQFIEFIKANQLTFHGVSFHVGSGCQSADSYAQAIQTAQMVFHIAKQHGIKLAILDIGGGFVNEGSIWTPVTATIRKTLAVFRQDFKNVEVIGEPGRFLAHTAFDLYVRIVGKKYNQKQGQYRYYINDGVYGAFNGKVFDHVNDKNYQISIFRDYGDKNDEMVNLDIYDGQNTRTMYNSQIYGPTCDSLDCVIEQRYLPELQIGDYLLFHHMGAYTYAGSSEFNGIQSARIFVDEN